ncbi:MAG: phage protease [Candidatus Competibacteraceae bacterium]
MLTVAFNTLLNADAPRVAPGWIQLLPAGRNITGLDGREWLNDAPDRVARETRIPLVVDFEHASEHRAPQGLDAPAAGWIERLEVRPNSSLWGQVEWTTRARQHIAEREYRYLSPTFLYAKESRRIVRLTSVGLTNQPNLEMTALNQEETPPMLPPNVTFTGNTPPKVTITNTTVLRKDPQAAKQAAKQPASALLPPVVTPEFVIPVPLSRKDRDWMDAAMKYSGISLRDAYERLIQEKAFAQAAKRQQRETFGDAYARALEEAHKAFWPEPDRNAANREEPDRLAHFSPTHRAAIEQDLAMNRDLSVDEAVDRFLINQRAQTAFAQARGQYPAFAQAMETLENAAFYAAHPLSR